MNREFRARLRTIRDVLLESAGEIEEVLKDWNKEPEEISEDEEFGEEAQEAAKEDTVNWSSADELPEKEGIYFKQLKELSTIDGYALKDMTIIGQVTNTMDLDSYVNKKTGAPGLIYRLVLSDPTDDILVICFDEMAKEFKQYMIGTKLSITKAWKVQTNKQKIPELHVGNYAKVEVVE